MIEFASCKHLAYLIGIQNNVNHHAGPLHSRVAQNAGSAQCAFSLERMHLILEHDNPILPAFEPEDNVRDYAHADVATELAAFVASRKELVALLEGLSEAQWQRKGILSKYGNGTLLEFAVHTVWHDLNHIEQIARTLKLSDALV